MSRQARTTSVFNNARESSSDDNASNLKVFYSRAAAHGFDTHKQGDGKERRNQAWTSIELAARFMTSTHSWIITTGSQWLECRIRLSTLWHHCAQ